MIKIITGFRENQYYTIPTEEAHKAYYLFTHPEERTVFSNGVALIGKFIQGIEPDWNALMGYNPTHELDSDDWNEIKNRGIDLKIRDSLYEAKQTALLAEKNPKLLNMELSEAKESIKLLK